MKELELFYLSNCPYCINARKALDELVKENPAFGEISIRWIEESEEPALVTGRDYYYVPSLFFRGKKLYEAKPSHDYGTIKEKLRAALEYVLQA